MKKMPPTHGKRHLNDTKTTCFGSSEGSVTLRRRVSHSVPLTQLFSNSFLRDLDKIWALREYIPDPIKPTYSKT